MEFRTAGPHAILVVFDDLAQVRRYYAEAIRRRAAGEIDGDVEIVPAARTILFDDVDDAPQLAGAVRLWEPKEVDAAAIRVVEIPVVYDGPDVDEVAEMWGVARAEVGEVHASLKHEVAFTGFSPGFAYISGLPEQLHVPRLDRPRIRVPGGSVAIADEFSAVYPRDSPGGWRLIGRTDVVMWDMDRAVPAYLAPGDAVRFVPFT